MIFFPIIAIALFGGFLLYYQWHLNQMRKLYEELRRRAFLYTIDTVLNSNSFIWRLKDKKN